MLSSLSVVSGLGALVLVCLQPQIAVCTLDSFFRETYTDVIVS